MHIWYFYVKGKSTHDKSTGERMLQNWPKEIIFTQLQRAGNVGNQSVAKLD